MYKSPDASLSLKCDRRSFLTAALTGATLYSPRAGARSAKRPNVILILTDDQGYGDVACNGNPYLHTPNMDRIASDGVRFNRFHVSPLCAPTRATLLTGRYHIRCGTHWVTSGRETMRTDETTIAKALKPAGYRTALFGKWHLVEHYPYVPYAQGFDEFVGFRTGNCLTYFDAVLERNGKPLQSNGYITDFLTDEALSFIERNRTEPFFLYLPYNAPHTPYQMPEEYYFKYRRMKLPPETAGVYGMIERVDENIGRLLKQLDDLGLADNTIIFFVGDNGPNGHRYNGGLRAAKGSAYEGGTRVPFFVRWPGKLPTGQSVNQIAAHIDVYPTILDLCGVAQPQALPIDGRSLRPLLEGNSQEWPDRRIHIFDWRPERPTEMYPGAVRTQRYNLIDGRELYDLSQDIGEQNDIASLHPDIVKELRSQYEQTFQQASKAHGFVRLPIPVGYWEENPVTLPATQCWLEMASPRHSSGKLRYFIGPAGFAHDWITNWTSRDDSAVWDVDVVAAGKYEISLVYRCSFSDVGSTVQVAVAGRSATGTVTQPVSMSMKPHRNLLEAEVYPVMNWGELHLGALDLPQGPSCLEVRALTVKGSTVMDLSSVRLKRIG